MHSKAARCASPTAIDNYLSRKKLRLSSPSQHCQDSFNTKSSSLKSSIHPHGILPEGNLILSSQTNAMRITGLGRLSVLPDSVIILILGFLDAIDLLSISSASRTLFAFSRHEQVWKNLFLKKSGGYLALWEGSWRKTFLRVLGHRTEGGCDKDNVWEWPCDMISVEGLYSDVLFQPFLCANTSIYSYFFPQPSQSRSTIPRHSALSLNEQSFLTLYASKSRPVIITHAMSHWPCFAAGTWKLENLVSRFRNVTFRVEAFECPISVYSSYAKDCTTEDCPLYLFDAKFVEKTGGTMGHEYAPLEFLGPDLFEGLGSDRPDYRWLIVGPSRSGSTFHKDPNGSAAWNAVVQGRKGWVLFHPDVCPPGVYVNSDESEVTAPLSLAEWFLGYFESSWKIYGPDGRDPSKRGRMMVGICEAGEIVYVPSGWWHLVINLEDSVAVTQNFVSMTELSGTLKFMMDKPDQLSGFSSIEKGVVHAKFLETLRVTKPDLSDWLHDCPGRPPDTRSSLWDSLNQDRSQDVSREFSFGFDLQDDESESSENL